MTEVLNVRGVSAAWNARDMDGEGQGMVTTRLPSPTDTSDDDDDRQQTADDRRQTADDRRQTIIMDGCIDGKTGWIGCVVLVVMMLMDGRAD